MINQIEPLISKKDAKKVYEYINSGSWITEHKVTKDFEDKIKKFVDRKFAVAVPNGTIAIYLALLSSGVKKGDKVAVPNLTMIATINAIIWAGAKPILVDVDDELTMSYQSLQKIKNLKAVIYVPLNGRTKNGIEIEYWCKNNGITLIEDSAHSLGSNYMNNTSCGKLGDVSIFSFTPHKIITMGQGGLVVTDNINVYKELIKIKTFNRRKDKLDWHDGFGLNFKITDMQAALGLSQFETIENRILKKKSTLKQYSKLNSEKCFIGKFKDFETPWFIDLHFNKKSDLIKVKKSLAKKNIETRISYPALSKQKYLKEVSKTDLSYSEKVFEKILWLPSSINLSRKNVNNILDVILESLEK